MVYQKKQYKKSKFNWKNANSAMSVASKALAIGIATKKLLNVETKYVDAYGAQTPSFGSPSIVCCNAIAQGDGGSTRDGDQVKVRSVQGRMLFRNDTANPVMARYMLVLDKQGDSANPTLAEILEGSTTAIQSLVSPLNMDNKMRFKVLLDKEVILQPNNQAGLWKEVKFYKQFKDGVRTRYSGTGAAATDISSNPIYLICWNNTSTGVPYDNYIRTRYVDN